MRSRDSGRQQWFQTIFVMQPSQDRNGNNSVAIRDSMPIWPCEPAERHVRNARSKAGVWSALAVMGHPLLKDGPKVPFIEQHQPIQTLTTDHADQALAERVRLWAAHWRFQHGQAHRGNRTIDRPRKNAVAVSEMNSPVHEMTRREFIGLAASLGAAAAWGNVVPRVSQIVANLSRGFERPSPEGEGFWVD